MLRTIRPTAVWLIAALAVALIARLPGVAWGVNWPDGFTLHHPDEYTHVANADAMISPLGPRGGVAYPKAMAAYAAAPYLLWYAAHGQFGGERHTHPVDGRGGTARQCHVRRHRYPSRLCNRT